MKNMIQLSSRQKKLLFLVFAGAISLVLQVIGGYQLIEFTDSTAFCGQLCHEVMYPEYTTYQASPHSRVLCSDCHVGPGASYLVKSKISGIPQIYNTILNTYPHPIDTPVENLRPARDTCEQCHWPDKFSGDIVRTHISYASDEANTESAVTRVLKVGGGQSKVASDIHWHISANVWYLALDEKRQEIAWVGVENPDGTLTEFADPQKARDATPERIREDKRLMDCIDCHNRATHIFYSPDELIDRAMLEGRIDKSLPFIKREAGKALNPGNPSLDEAISKVEAIRGFYRSSYPQLSVEKRLAIDGAINELKEVARLTTFPYMKVDWNTHIDNSGHQKWPGCYRCHGKLVETVGTQPKRTVDATCDSCHYALTLEQIVGPSITHLIAGREECTGCHGLGAVKPYPTDHAGRPDSSCDTCHKQTSVKAAVIPHRTEGREDCLLCHGQGAISPYPANHTGRTNITCTLCHNAVPVAAVNIPHRTQGLTDCLICHSGDKLWPFPANHAGRTNITCALCHNASPVTAVNVPHTIAGITDCLPCHGAGGIRPFPAASHAGRTSNTCTLCHAVAPVSAPRITHSLTGRENCLQCHNTGGIRPFPAGHTGFTNNTCTLCHKT